RLAPAADQGQSEPRTTGTGTAAPSLSAGSSKSVTATPSSHLSNQRRISCWFCTRRDGAPLLVSSWPSPGKRAITAVFFCAISARYIASPWAIGVRQSSSLCSTSSGVSILPASATGERRRKSSSPSNGALRNHVLLNCVKSALYQNDSHSLTQRCVIAALKRCVCVIAQLVRSPPPEPPVMPSRFAST